MLELKVTGMTCGGCVNSVRRATQRVIAGANPEIDLASGRFSLDVPPSELERLRPQVVAAIEAAGFGAEVPGS